MTPHFLSCSEVGQDRFVHALLGHHLPGRFLDIGCGRPIHHNNTYALERIGWTGLLVDSNESFIEECLRFRCSPALCVDATTISWKDAIQVGFAWPDVINMPENGIDYLSLDVDSHTLAALKNMPMDLRFKIITIEHDAYVHGPGPRDAMRQILWGAGYTLAVADVRCGGGEFEDWWIDPKKICL